MAKSLLISLILIFCIVTGFGLYIKLIKPLSNQDIPKLTQTNNGGSVEEPRALSIEYMRKQEYPGSEITIEQTLSDGSNYHRYIASYLSQGLIIYALLTVPIGQKPSSGWPVIIFNHGYIPPEQYKTTEKYIAYTDAFSRNGYIVFRSDYRGHGNSEGKPEGAYYSPAYTIDVLNGLASIKKLKAPSASSGQAPSASSGQAPSINEGLIADSSRIGMWGHSMGGMITLRSMVITKDVKVGVIWAGVVASYPDLTNNWHHPDLNPRPFIPSQREQASGRPGRQQLISKYGSFETNPRFWQSIAPISFVSDISGPIQLQHGTADSEVPLLFSQKLDEALKNAGKPVEFFTYEGDNHNLSNNLTLALKRSVEFFDKYLK